MDIQVLLISALVFLAIVSLVAGLAVFRGVGGLDERLEAYRSGAQGEGSTIAETSLKRRSYSGSPALSAFLSQFRSSEQVALQLERAGVPLRVGEYYLIRFGLAFVFFIAPFLFSQSMMTVVVAIALSAGAYVVAPLYIQSKRASRTRRVNAQLVEMLGLVANSLKSGYGLMQSFEFASRQMYPPLSSELRRMLRDANLGMSAEGALNAMGSRIESTDLDIVLTAVNIQRAVGGNLAEVLEKVSFTMRERERIRGEIKTLTTQQLMTGVLVGSMPVAMMGIFMVINPAYMSLLFTETAGRIILLAAAGLEVAGIFAIRRMLAIEI